VNPRALSFALPRGAAPRLIVASAGVSGATLLCNLALFWREIVAAEAFGVGAALDGFILASLLPVFVSGLLAGALAPALVPALAAERLARGADATRVMVTAFHLRLVLGAAVLVLLMWVFAEGLLWPLCRGLAPDQQSAVIGLFRLLSLLIVIQASSAVWKAALNLQGRMVLPALTPALAPLAGVALLVGLPFGRGVELLAWGMLAGAILEWSLLALAARATHAWSPRALFGRTLPGVLSSYATLLAAAATTTSAWLVDNAMAASLPAGSVAALGFGGKVVSFGIGIIGIGVSTAVLPVAVDLAGRRQWGELHRLAMRFGGLLLITGVPVSCAIVAWSADLTALLYQRGEFDADATALVASVQSALAAQVPFHVLGILCVRLLSALQMNRQVLGIALAGTALNIGLNLALMPLLGVVGIATATSAMFATTCVLSAWAVMSVLRRRMQADAGACCT
jgi:putative peptidoglycan lipid II flippase